MENNNQKKIGLTILHFVGVVLWTLTFFFGFNYWAGDVVVSSCVSLALALLMVFFVDRMMSNCVKVDSNSIFFEKLFLTLYIIVSLASCVYLYHMVTVTAQTKTEIQQYVRSQRAEVDMYFDSTNASGYVRYVEDRYDAHNHTTGDFWKGKWANFSYLKFGGDGKIFDKIKSTSYENFKIYSDAVEKWNWFKVSNSLKLVTSEKLSIENQLIELSKTEREGAVEKIPYEPSKKYNEDQSKKIETISKDGSFLLTALLAVVLQAMILTLYLKYKKDNGRSICKSNDMGIMH